MMWMTNEVLATSHNYFYIYKKHVATAKNNGRNKNVRNAKYFYSPSIKN
jgi:hypothetical protein